MKKVPNNNSNNQPSKKTELQSEKEYLVEKEPNESQEQTNIQDHPPEEKPKKMIEIKPRETYLKDKIGKLNFNNNILSGINKGIYEKLISVKNEIISQEINLREMPKSVKRYVNKSFDLSSNSKNDNINNKNKYKTIKDLKIERDNLNRKLLQIMENEKLLENEDNIGLVVEKNIKEKIKKDSTIQKNKILEKIEIINEKIKNMMLDDELNIRKQTNLRNFIDNFERDKEIVEIRAKKYLKEKKERKKRLDNDLNQLAEKRKKEIEDKNIKQKQDQEKMILKLKRQAKEIEDKRSKEIGAQSILYKPYINGKIEGGIKNYLFKQKYDKFLKEEQSLLDKEKFNRKNKMKQVSNEEIEEFNNKMDKKREEKKLEKEQKKEKLLKEWEERKKTLPTYVNPLSEVACNDISKQFNDLQEKNEKAKELLKKKMDYSEEVAYLHSPHIDKELEQKRIETIKSLDAKNIILEKDKNKKENKRKGRVILKKPDPNKPSKYTWKLKILNNSDNEISIEKALIKRPKQIKTSISLEKGPNKLPEIKKDYLQELIKEKENKEQKNINVKSYNSLKTDNYVQSASKKWDKLIIDKVNKGNLGNKELVDNINNARSKIELLDLRAIRSQKLLNVQEPTSNEVELNKKVSSLLIDSIEAKLSLLNQMK